MKSNRSNVLKLVTPSETELEILKYSGVSICPLFTSCALLPTDLLWCHLVTQNQSLCLVPVFICHLVWCRRVSWCCSRLWERMHKGLRFSIWETARVTFPLSLSLNYILTRKSHLTRNTAQCRSFFSDDIGITAEQEKTLPAAESKKTAKAKLSKMDSSSHATQSLCWHHFALLSKNKLLNNASGQFRRRRLKLIPSCIIFHNHLSKGFWTRSVPRKKNTWQRSLSLWA